MNKLGVIGNKISYSLSPDIHKLFAEQFGIEVDYQTYDLDEDPNLFIKKFFITSFIFFCIVVIINILEEIKFTEKN